MAKANANARCSQEAIDREIENKLATQRSATDARDSQAERLKDIVERTTMCGPHIDSSVRSPSDSQEPHRRVSRRSGLVSARRPGRRGPEKEVSVRAAPHAHRLRRRANIGKTKIAKVGAFNLPSSNTPVTPALFTSGLPPADREVVRTPLGRSRPHLIQLRRRRRLPLD